MVELTDLVIPEGVTHLANHAPSMSGLTRMVVPAGVIQVGDAAFAGCTQLTNVVMESEEDPEIT